MTQPSSPKRPHAVAALLLALAPAAPARAQLDPLLPQAFFTTPCPNPGSAGSVVPGSDLWKIGVAPFFPDALCNDGTRAVFYVRRYADDAYSCATGSSVPVRSSWKRPTIRPVPRRATAPETWLPGRPRRRAGVVPVEKGSARGEAAQLEPVAVLALAELAAAA